VTLPQGLSDEKLWSFHNAIKEEYPDKKQRVQWTQHLQVPQAGGPLELGSTDKLNGHMFFSGDNKRVVQVTPISFAFSQLKPYDTWAVFKAEAKRIWEKYWVIMQPISINRTSLRYINRIEIPFPVGELRDYCLLFPEFPMTMPQEVGNFFVRFESFDREIGAMGVVTLALEPIQPAVPFVVLIFDIDVGFLEGSMSSSPEETWAKFDLLRLYKNRIFHSNLTDRAKKLFA